MPIFCVVCTTFHHLPIHTHPPFHSLFNAVLFAVPHAELMALLPSCAVAPHPAGHTACSLYKDITFPLLHLVLFADCNPPAAFECKSIHYSSLPNIAIQKLDSTWELLDAY
jgi:hypothetical protein